MLYSRGITIIKAEIPLYEKGKEVPVEWEVPGVITDRRGMVPSFRTGNDAEKVCQPELAYHRRKSTEPGVWAGRKDRQRRVKDTANAQNWAG